MYTDELRIIDPEHEAHSCATCRHSDSYGGEYGHLHACAECVHEGAVEGADNAVAVLIGQDGFCDCYEVDAGRFVDCHGLTPGQWERGRDRPPAADRGLRPGVDFPLTLV